MLRYVLGEARGRRIQQNGAKCEAGNVLQDIGMLDSLCDGFAPGEGSVTGNEDTRYGDGVKAFSAEAAEDNWARVGDGCVGDFLGGQGVSFRNRAVAEVF